MRDLLLFLKETELKVRIGPHMVANADSNQINIKQLKTYLIIFERACIVATLSIHTGLSFIYFKKPQSS